MLPRGLRIFVNSSRLANGSPTDQVDDCEQDHRPDQRIEDGGEVERATARNPLAENEAGDNRAHDSDNDVEDDALLSVGPHDQARKPTDHAADNEVDDYPDHEPNPPVSRPPIGRCGTGHHGRVMRPDCSANGRVRPEIWLRNAENAWLMLCRNDRQSRMASLSSAAGARTDRDIA